MSDQSDPKVIDEAIAIAAERAQLRESLKGKRIRVVRAVVYEGDADMVLDNIERSLPIGTRHNTYHGGTYHGGKQWSISVSQGPIKVLEE
jgi:hypothetical protein